MRDHPLAGLLAAALASSVVHGIAYASLGLAPARHEPPLSSRVTVRVSPPPVAPEPPPPDPLPPRPEPPRPAPREQRPTPAPEPTAPPAEAVPETVDLRGVTLTNDTGSARGTSMVGNGASFEGALGPVAGLRRSPAAAPAAPAPRRAVVPLVALADLSQKPVPPALAGALKQHYPLDAKRRGLGGSASVEARVDPDGRIRQARLVAESLGGFGAACRQTLLGSVWSPPKDHSGRAVSTLIRYTCRFVVQP